MSKVNVELTISTIVFFVFYYLVDVNWIWNKSNWYNWFRRA